MKKTKLILLALMAVFVGASAQPLPDAPSEAPDITPADIPAVPQKLWTKAEKQGTIEVFSYDVTRDGRTWRKNARVYLPYGYNAADTKAQYNVLYLMHGGGDNSRSFLTPPQDWLRLCDVLDHMIADKLIDPLIVVTPTFYDDDENIGANSMQNAIDLTMNFHKELRACLIPTVEKKYNTFLRAALSTPEAAVSDDLITSTRTHRAFGGFSMGSLTTWYQLIGDCAAVKYYIPLSGDIWHFGEGGKRDSYKDVALWVNAELEKSPYKNDFMVFGYTGTDDLAAKPQRNIVAALNAFAPVFRFGKPDANLFFSMRQGGRHFYGDVNQYLYFALPLLWK
ncbi:MAG: hypothetical protein HUK08_07520 [Bacteroidaceae bacterium]|nr:hypothetical protein [Bacteroidaceae bacterium]